jgi:release factor glutamine methyltransferase
MNEKTGAGKPGSKQNSFAQNEPTAGSLLQWAVSYFRENYLEGDRDKINCRLEGEVLLAHVLKLNRTKLLAELGQGVDGDLAEQFRRLVTRRAVGYPLQYLTGKENFMSLDFVVTEGVLIPRSDTEVLVEQAIELLKQIDLPVLLVADICTGSGAVGLSIAHYVPNAWMFLTDISDKAIETATENCNRLGLENRVAMVAGDLLEPLEQWMAGAGAGARLDMIVSNPPYISTDGWQLVEPGVKEYEPRLALDGGDDGLAFYHQLIPGALPFLKPGGYLLLEIGYDQGDAVQLLFQQTGAYAAIRVVKDYGGRDRVVMGRKKT